MKHTSYLKRNIGCSQVPEIMGVGFGTPNQQLDLCVRSIKAKKEISNDLSGNPKVQAGIKLEPVIAEMALDKLRTFNKSIKFEEVKEGKFIKLAPYATLGASLDRIISLKDKEKLIFTDTENIMQSLYGIGNCQIKNFSGAPGVPLYEYVETQVQAEMLASSLPWTLIVRFTQGWDIQLYVRFANKQIQEKIKYAVIDFWERVEKFLDGKEAWYDFETSKEVSKLLKGNQSKKVIDLRSDNHLPGLVIEYVQAKESEVASKDMKIKAEREIKKKLGENEYAEINGFKISHQTVFTKETVIKRPASKTRRFSIRPQ